MLSFGILHTCLMVGNFKQGGQTYAKRVLCVD